MTSTFDRIRDIARRTSLGSDAAANSLVRRADFRFDIRDMDGCDLTGTHDMASTLAKAIANAKASGDTLHLPAGVIALGSKVDVPSGVNILGVGTRPYTTLADSGSRGPGSWLHLAHSDVGLACANPGEFGSGTSFSKIGTFRDQPAVGAGWEPNDHDFDFTVDNGEVQFSDVMLLNATRGIRQLRGDAGRLYLDKLRGSPFLMGVQIDDSYDGFIVEGIRWWPFWSNDAYTRAFTKAQGVGMYLRHCDNPRISGYFNIFRKTGVRIGSGPNGVVNSAYFYNLENDLIGDCGIEFDSSSTGSHVTLIGGYTYAEPGSTDAARMNGNNDKLVLVGHKAQAIRRSAVRMGAGTGNVCQVNAPDVNWNVDNGGHAAFTNTPGNVIDIQGRPIVSGGNGAPLVVGGAAINAYKPSHAAAVAISLDDKLGSQPVIPESYYQPTDPDWTNAINRALATGRDVYLHQRESGDGWAISDALVYKAGASQRLIGQDPGSSYLKVDSNFNMAAAAIIDMRPAADGRYVGAENIGIECAQPLTATTRGQLRQYPVAIDLSGIFRPRFGGVIRIAGAWDGMKATGFGGSGSGGFSADVLDIGAINLGLDVDGVADFFTVNALRCWPHGFEAQTGGSASLLAIWGDGTTRGTRWGRCEAIDVKSLAGFQCRHIFQNGENGAPTFGGIGHLALDGDGSTLVFNAGYVQIASLYASASVAERQGILMAGGILAIGPHRTFGPNGSAVSPYIAQTGGRLFMASGEFATGPSGLPLIDISGGELTLAEPTFSYGANTTRTVGFVRQSGTGKVTLDEPRFVDKGTGSGDAITITTDVANVIEAHALGGWNVSLPASIANGYYDLDMTFNTAPTVQFATAGDSVFTYTTQTCQYRLSGNVVDYSIVLTFNTNAYTTAAGAFRINPNIPFAPRLNSAATLGELGNVTFSGMVTGEMITDKSLAMRLLASNAALSNVGPANILPSKTGVQIAFSGSYIV